MPSPRVAGEPSVAARRCLASPRAGIPNALAVTSAMPSQLVSARSPLTSASSASTVTYGASRKSCAATSFCARSSAAPERSRPPLKRQTMTTLASPSITESRPKATSAIEPASTPATTAIAPSSAIQASETQESSRARPAARSHSADGAAAEAVIPLV